MDSSNAIFTQARLPDFKIASSHSFTVIASELFFFSIGVVCEAEQDSVWGLVFPTTLAGFSYSQQCPQNGNGTTLGM